MAWSVYFIAVSGLVLLFAAAVRAPQGSGRWRIGVRVLGVAGALAAAALANVAVYRNDLHFDATGSEAFTLAPETLRVLEGLAQDVELTYFYQAQNPAGRAARDMVELMGKVSPRLSVRTVDPDQKPALANQLGVRMYNAALLRAGERRVEVITTEDREIALALLRLLRDDRRPLCFLTGHGEYEIDNFEFHTHLEGQPGHRHDSVGLAVVNMDQHGIGRLRRALDKLGYAVRKLGLGSGAVPADCAALIGANPRTPYTPPEVALLEQYLQGGGNLLLLLEPDYALGSELSALLARAGISVGEGVVVDPAAHYFNDEQMLAVERYAAHPATLGLALSIFPGIRPLQALPVPGVQPQVLFSSSARATVAGPGGSAALDANPAPRALAVASTGQWGATGKPFRVAVVGDADFASNSFYPYLSNADLVLGLAAWLRGEPRGPAMKPPVEVLPTVMLTSRQTVAIFLLCVVLLPGLTAAAGIGVWWWRRR